MLPEVLGITNFTLNITKCNNSHHYFYKEQSYQTPSRDQLVTQRLGTVKVIQCCLMFAKLVEFSHIGLILNKLLILGPAKAFIEGLCLELTSRIPNQEATRAVT